MSVLISSQLKPSYYKRYDVKASAQRPTRAAAKIPNKKARFAEIVMDVRRCKVFYGVL